MMRPHYLTAAERLALTRIAAGEVTRRPLKLTPVPRAHWPHHRRRTPAPIEVWISRKYLVQLYAEDDFQNIATRRLAVCRIMNSPDESGQIAPPEEISWEELFEIKAGIGFATWYGVEIYPRAGDEVKVGGVRHLWLLAQPLALGWFTQDRINAHEQIEPGERVPHSGGTQ